MSIKGIGIGGTRGAVAPSSQLLGGPSLLHCIYIRYSMLIYSPF